MAQKTFLSTWITPSTGKGTPSLSSTPHQSGALAALGTTQRRLMLRQLETQPQCVNDTTLEFWETGWRKFLQILTRTIIATPQLLLLSMQTSNTVGEPADALHRDIEDVSAPMLMEWRCPKSSQELIRSSQHSGISSASLVLRRVAQLQDWSSSPTRQRSAKLDVTCQTRPRDGPSVFERTHT